MSQNIFQYPWLSWLCPKLSYRSPIGGDDAVSPPLSTTLRAGPPEYPCHHQRTSRTSDHWSRSGSIISSHAKVIASGFGFWTCHEDKMIVWVFEVWINQMVIARSLVQQWKPKTVIWLVSGRLKMVSQFQKELGNVSEEILGVYDA